VVVRYLIVVSFGWRDLTLESSSETALDILVDCATDSMFRPKFQAKQFRMFNCHFLIDQLVPDEEVPCHIDRWSENIPLELRKSGQTGGKVEADRMFFDVRINNVVTKGFMDVFFEVRQVANVRLEIKKRSLTLNCRKKWQQGYSSAVSQIRCRKDQRR
jgi:hypothetical protein